MLGARLEMIVNKNWRGKGFSDKLKLAADTFLFYISAVSGHIVLQPPSDLVLVPSDPFDVVPHCLQCLLPRHLPGTSIRC